MSERILKLRIYVARRRFFRFGTWADWTLEIVNDYEGVQWIQPVAKGLIRRSPDATFAEFTFGDETDVSRRLLAVSYGIAT